MDPAKPSLDLLRQLSDRAVLGALVDAPRLTRARIAERTGLSKPTVGESIRRLVSTGLVRDTGERTTGPGRAGTLFALADGLGVGLAVAIAPDGVRVDALDVRGATVGTAVEPVAATTTPDTVVEALAVATRTALREAGAPARVAVVSAADPVDRRSGRLVHLPDAPFLVGELDPAEILGRFVHPLAGDEGDAHAAVVVDNDVNWAARAERDADPDLTDAAYLYLDQGLGCAVLGDGRVLRGAHGLAGEVSHVVTTGPDGRAVPFTELFAVLGLRQEGSTAIDVPAVLAVLRGDSRTTAALATGVAGVVAALVALADPAVVLLGGTWGRQPTFVEALRHAVDRPPRPVPVRAGTVSDAALTGVRGEAARAVRDRVLDVRMHS